MLNFNETKMNKIVVHHVGNKNNAEYLNCSKHPLHLKDDFIKQILMQYFLNPFKTEALYHLSDAESLDKNKVYELVSAIFDDAETFYDNSMAIAQFLFDSSNHPKIKGGEFYVVYFKDCQVEDEITDAIGLFKSENKETYLKVFQRNDDYQIATDDGINISKLDKGCIIFNTNKENGYLATMVDNLNKTNEAQYWKEDFLGLKPYQNSFYNTQSILNMTKEFCELALIEEEEISQKDQLFLKDRSMKYFAEKDTFSQKDFESEVLQEPEIIEAFQHFKQQYINNENILDTDEFGISKSALNSAKKNFKSVVKLDKNFHLYIHGSPDLFEKGYDENRDMNFYKLFYNQEA